jgi:arylsulfatase A-like enzyme
MEPHLPYAPPPPERGRFSRGTADTLSYPIDGLHALRRRLDELSARDREFLGDAYDEEVAAVDRHLGELFALLDRLDLWHTTLVVLTSDHGEELFEHGGFEHGHTLYDEVIRVPLVVWSPGSRPGRRARPASLTDVVPTILDALGFAGDPAGVDGVSHWASIVTGDEPARSPVIASGNLHTPPTAGAIQWPLKVVVGSAAAPLVFDLAQDPAERHVLEPVPAEAERLIALARTLLDREQEESGQVTLDDDTLERLRSLGYLD